MFFFDCMEPIPLTDIIHFEPNGKYVSSCSPSPFPVVASEYILNNLGDMLDFNYDSKNKRLIINWKNKASTYLYPKQTGTNKTNK